MGFGDKVEKIGWKLYAPITIILVLISIDFIFQIIFSTKLGLVDFFVKNQIGGFILLFTLILSAFGVFFVHLGKIINDRAGLLDFLGFGIGILAVGVVIYLIYLYFNEHSLL